MRHLIITLFFAMFALTATAQVQHGVVKTRGRLQEDGSVKPGKTIKDGVIKIKNHGSYITNTEGQFSFYCSDGSFYIEDVIVEGYTPIDNDIYMVEYKVDRNTPIYITVDIPDRIVADALMAESRMKESLKQRVEASKAELDELKLKNEITIAQYKERLQKLQDEKSRAEKLIGELSAEYTSVDFDMIEQSNMQIYNLILSGNIDAADSLLNSRGVVEDDIMSLQRRQAYTAEIKEGLKANEEKRRRNIEALARDYYNRYLICLDKERTDSACYYLEKRALLDTMHIEYQLELADFYTYRQSNYQGALDIYQAALNRTAQKYGEKHRKIVEIYCLISNVYNEVSYYEWAYEFMQKAYDLLQEILPEDQMMPTIKENLEDLQFMVEIYGSSHS